jgi:hypothetical protein
VVPNPIDRENAAYLAIAPRDESNTSVPENLFNHPAPSGKMKECSIRRGSYETIPLIVFTLLQDGNINVSSDLRGRRTHSGPQCTHRFSS